MKRIDIYNVSFIVARTRVVAWLFGMATIRCLDAGAIHMSWSEDTVDCENIVNGYHKAAALSLRAIQFASHLPHNWRSPFLIPFDSAANPVHSLLDTCPSQRAQR